MRRRQFLGSSVLLPIFANRLRGREPVQRTGDARFRSALAAYSLRDYFSYMKEKENTPKNDGKSIDMFKFIDYCATLKCDAAELTSYFFPPNVDDGYLLELRQHAFLSGISISGTAIGNDFTVNDPAKLASEVEYSNRWIKRAAVLGAPHVRIFAGTAQQLGESKQRMHAIGDSVATIAKTAAENGVFLGIENHGGISSAQLLEVMDRVQSDWVGINLDTGNFLSTDPYADMQSCLPYAVNVQFKPSLRTPEGKLYAADFTRIATLMKKSGYRGFVALEYEEENPYERIPYWFEKMETALREA